MRPLARLLALAPALVLSACAATSARQPVDYRAMPGSGDSSARGTGLLGKGHHDPETGGTLLYSDDPDKPAMISGRSDTPQADTATPTATPSPATDRDREGRSDDAADYQDFEAFKAFRRFQQLPPDAPQRRAFRQWRQWQHYRDWQRTHDGRPDASPSQ